MIEDAPLTGKSITEARETLGLTQEDLAKRIGMKRVLTISRWENGHRDPSLSPYRSELLKVIEAATTARKEMTR